MAHIVTAQRLVDGKAVFRTEGGSWSEAYDDAAILSDKEAADAAIEASQSDVDARLIVEPYRIDLRDDGEGLRPVRLRERIRASGLPTVGNAL